MGKKLIKNRGFGIKNKANRLLIKIKLIRFKKFRKINSWGMRFFQKILFFFTFLCVFY